MCRLLKIFCFFSLFFIGSVFADEQEVHNMYFGDHPTPWFTGPLLAPSANTVLPGHVKLQPYLNTRVIVGDYDSHWHVVPRDNFYTEELRFKTKIGIAKRLDFEFSPILLYRETQGRHSVNIADLPLVLNIQILSSKALGRGPALKLGLRADIPTGKYQKLDPAKKRTDETGTGCWFPGVSLSCSNIWYISGFHYFEIRALAQYRVGVPVHVKGLNTYGGDQYTRGTAYPGNYLILDTAVEYSLTQRWALACDFVYLHRNRDRFFGKNGTFMRHPSAEEFSVAPAIEYSWSKNMGVVGGVWFSVAGRNIAQFINGMLSLNAYF